MERTFKEKLSEKLMSFAGIIGKNIYLLSLRDAFMLSFPLTMFGSILLVVTNFPGFSEKAREGLGALMGHSIESSMLLMSIFVSIGIGYYLYLYKNPKRTQDAIYSGAVALVSFFIVTPFSVIIWTSCNIESYTCNTVDTGITNNNLNCLFCNKNWNNA